MSHLLCRGGQRIDRINLYFWLREKCWSVSLRCQKWQKIFPRVTYPPIPTVQVDTWNKQWNILKIGFKFSFFAVAFIFTFCFLCEHAMELSQFLYTSILTRIETQGGIVCLVGENLRQGPVVWLHRNSNQKNLTNHLNRCLNATFCVFVFSILSFNSVEGWIVKSVT